jgi:hypothetical protein
MTILEGEEGLPGQARIIITRLTFMAYRNQNTSKNRQPQLRLTSSSRWREAGIPIILQ